MPQTAVQNTKTCSTCPNFKDFQEPTGRGWCNLFNQQARTHHQQTNDCVISADISISHELEDNLTIFPNVDFQDLDAFPTEPLKDEADLPHSEYEVGCIVKIIDPLEHHSEWRVFEVVECRHNSHLYDTAETYLNQAEWYYRLSSTNNTSSPLSKELWIAQNDICTFDMSHNVSTQDIF